MKIAFCADIHINDDTFIDEIMNCFETMISMSDMIVIGGDLMDCKSYASSDAIQQLLRLFDFITPQIRGGGRKLRIIYGTQSHDSYPQLQILKPYTKLMDCKIINHAQEEIINGTKFLFIPEEIIQDKTVYYKDTLFSGKQYDYIFGHGVIAEGMSMVKESDNKIKSVPIFKTMELKQAVKYHCCFGHYHRRWESDNIAYVGSLSRFHHGEPEQKGWYLLDGKQRIFHPNQWCPDFQEYKVKCSEYTPSDLQIWITNTITSFQQSKQERDKLKFTFFLDRSQEDAIPIIDSIRTLCRGDGIAYNIKDVNEAIIQDRTIESEYDYILDINVPIIDKIIKYNNHQFDGSLDDTLLKNYLSKIKS